MDEVAVGDITVFRVDHQSVEVRESDFNFLAIFSSHVLFDYFINETTLFLSFLNLSQWYCKSVCLAFL